MKLDKNSLLFFGFGALFLVLSIIMSLKSANYYTLGFYLHHTEMLKKAVNFTSFSFSMLAFLLGYSQSYHAHDAIDAINEEA